MRLLRGLCVGPGIGAKITLFFFFLSCRTASEDGALTAKSGGKPSNIRYCCILEIYSFCMSFLCTIFFKLYTGAYRHSGARGGGASTAVLVNGLMVVLLVFALSMFVDAAEMLAVASKT